MRKRPLTESVLTEERGGGEDDVGMEEGGGAEMRRR